MIDHELIKNLGMGRIRAVISLITQFCTPPNTEPDEEDMRVLECCDAFLEYVQEVINEAEKADEC